MTAQIAYALVAFAFVTTVTPGPNNVMLMASGANFGVRRTLPHMLGIALGLVSMILLLGFGLAQVFERLPAAGTVLKALAIAYLLYLAWRIATAEPRPDAAPGAEARPMTALEAAAFQWVNPKAWAMALTGVTVYLPDRTALTILVAAALFFAVCLPCVSLWAALGQQLRRVLTNPARRRAFNVTMALLLVATLWPILTH
ncbi:transporter, LysE family putative [Oceanicola granulosus HTCC2516]|uniref:Transporter, LysE family putative n=1 Tax=Oceanicola granulosus (strain ATCC BAA-861 / DSM 15982 / KCTC 12143 / HTCC2516) TaxID=314256 RepID=Q2CFV7_OCEGH|nr:LysE family translocator [Oceanicola granulosus]EAR51585.1 transporter, LysE family putative [Oceanicola granulosus HTCC2516]